MYVRECGRESLAHSVAAVKHVQLPWGASARTPHLLDTRTSRSQNWCILACVFSIYLFFFRFLQRIHTYDSLCYIDIDRGFGSLYVIAINAKFVIVVYLMLLVVRRSFRAYMRSTQSLYKSNDFWFQCFRHRFHH